MVGGSGQQDRVGRVDDQGEGSEVDGEDDDNGVEQLPLGHLSGPQG